MKKIILLQIFIISLFCSCNKIYPDATPEDISKIYKLEPPEKSVVTPGVPFFCFPKSPGETGFEYKASPFKEKEEYTVNITVDCTAREYDNTDPQNLSILILQYLNEDGTMVEDTIMNGHEKLNIRKNKRGKTIIDPFEVYKEIPLTKKSGEPAYFAVFYSPYGNLDFSVSMNVSTLDETVEFPEMSHRYSVKAESFHITEKGVEYMINSQAMMLP